MRKFLNPDDYVSSSPDSPSLVYSSTKIMEDGFVKEVLSLVPLDSVDTRDNFSADDFRLDNLINSGSLDLLKNTVSLSQNPIETNDNVNEVLNSIKSNN